MVGHYNVSTLSLSDDTTPDLISQAFPLHVCMLQVIEGGTYALADYAIKSGQYAMLLCYLVLVIMLWVGYYYAGNLSSVFTIH